MNRLLTNSALILFEGGKEYLNTLLIQTFNYKAKRFPEILILNMNYVQSKRQVVFTSLTIFI